VPMEVELRGGRLTDASAAPLCTKPGSRSEIASELLMASAPKIGLLVERHCALAAALIAAGICWWQWGRVPFPSGWKTARRNLCGVCY
jgi:hypothetical protein